MHSPQILRRWRIEILNPGVSNASIWSRWLKHATGKRVNRKFGLESLFSMD